MSFQPVVMALRACVSLRGLNLAGLSGIMRICICDYPKELI